MAAHIVLGIVFILAQVEAATFYHADGLSFSGSVTRSPLGRSFTMEEFSSFPAGIGGSPDFRGGIFDGTYAWMIPWNADGVLRIDPTDASMVAYTSYPSGVGTTWTFWGGSFDGTYIWMTPFNAGAVVRLAVSDGSMVKFDSWPSGMSSTGSWAFAGGSLAPGNAWLVPYYASEVVIVDVSDGSMTKLACTVSGVDFDSRGFRGAVFDGTYMWFATSRESAVVRVHATSLAQVGYSSFPAGLTGTEKFAGGAYDGTYVWLAPEDANQVVRVDTGTGAMTGYSGWPAAVNSIGSEAFRSSYFDGEALWLIPYDSDYLVRVDTSVTLGDMTEFDNWPSGFSIPNNAFLGGVHDGSSLWLVPMDSDSAIRIIPSNTRTATSSPTITPAETETPTASPTPTAVPSATPSGTRTPTLSSSTSQSRGTPSPTLSLVETPTATPSLSVTSSPSQTVSVAPSPTASSSATCTLTPSLSMTRTTSATPTMAPTPSLTASATLTPSATASPTEAPTATATPSASPSVTGSLSLTRTVPRTPSLTASGTATHSSSASPTKSATATASMAPTRSVTKSMTASPTAPVTPSSTASMTATPTATISQSNTATGTASPSPSPSATGSRSPTPSPTRSMTCTRSNSPMETPTASNSRSRTESVAATTSVSRSSPPTKTPPPTSSGTILATPSAPPSQTQSTTSSWTATPSVSTKPTATSPKSSTNAPTATLSARPTQSASTTVDVPILAFVATVTVSSTVFPGTVNASIPVVAAVQFNRTDTPVALLERVLMTLTTTCDGGAITAAQTVALPLVSYRSPAATAGAQSRHADVLLTVPESLRAGIVSCGYSICQAPAGNCMAGTFALPVRFPQMTVSVTNVSEVSTPPGIALPSGLAVSPSSPPAVGARLEVAAKALVGVRVTIQDRRCAGNGTVCELDTLGAGSSVFMPNIHVAVPRYHRGEVSVAVAATAANTDEVFYARFVFDLLGSNVTAFEDVVNASGSWVLFDVVERDLGLTPQPGGASLAVTPAPIGFLSRATVSLGGSEASSGIHFVIWTTLAFVVVLVAGWCWARLQIRNGVVIPPHEETGCSTTATEANPRPSLWRFGVAHHLWASVVLPCHHRCVSIHVTELYVGVLACYVAAVGVLGLTSNSWTSTSRVVLSTLVASVALPVPRALVSPLFNASRIPRLVGFASERSHVRQVRKKRLAKVQSFRQVSRMSSMTKISRSRTPHFSHADHTATPFEGFDRSLSLSTLPPLVDVASGNRRSIGAEDDEDPDAIMDGDAKAVFPLSAESNAAEALTQRHSPSFAKFDQFGFDDDDVNVNDDTKLGVTANDTPTDFSITERPIVAPPAQPDSDGSKDSMTAFSFPSMSVQSPSPQGTVPPLPPLPPSPSGNSLRDDNTSRGGKVTRQESILVKSTGSRPVSANLSVQDSGMFSRQVSSKRRHRTVIVEEPPEFPSGRRSREVTPRVGGTTIEGAKWVETPEATPMAAPLDGAIDRPFGMSPAEVVLASQSSNLSAAALMGRTMSNRSSAAATPNMINLSLESSRAATPADETALESDLGQTHGSFGRLVRSTSVSHAESRSGRNSPREHSADAAWAQSWGDIPMLRVSPDGSEGGSTVAAMESGNVEDSIGVGAISATAGGLADAEPVPSEPLVVPVQPDNEALVALTRNLAYFRIAGYIFAAVMSAAACVVVLAQTAQWSASDEDAFWVAVPVAFIIDCFVWQFVLMLVSAFRRWISDPNDRDEFLTYIRWRHPYEGEEVHRQPIDVDEKTSGLGSSPQGSQVFLPVVKEDPPEMAAIVDTKKEVSGDGRQSLDSNDGPSSSSLEGQSEETPEEAPDSPSGSKLDCE